MWWVWLLLLGDFVLEVYTVGDFVQDCPRSQGKKMWLSWGEHVAIHSGRAHGAGGLTAKEPADSAAIFFSQDQVFDNGLFG